MPKIRTIGKPISARTDLPWPKWISDLPEPLNRTWPILPRPASAKQLCAVTQSSTCSTSIHTRRASSTQLTFQICSRCFKLHTLTSIMHASMTHFWANFKVDLSLNIFHLGAQPLLTMFLSTTSQCLWNCSSIVQSWWLIQPSLMHMLRWCIFSHLWSMVDSKTLELVCNWLSISYLTIPLLGSINQFSHLPIEFLFWFDEIFK